MQTIYSCVYSPNTLSRSGDEWEDILLVKELPDLALLFQSGRGETGEMLAEWPNERGYIRRISGGKERGNTWEIHAFADEAAWI